MLKTRVLTAAILLPLVLGALIYGPKWFVALFFFACALLGLFEALAMLLPAMERSMTRAADSERQSSEATGHYRIFERANMGTLTIAFVFAAALFLSSVADNPASGRGLLIVGLLSVLVVGMFLSKNIELAAVRSTTMVVAIVYSVCPWLVVWDLYMAAPHARQVLLVAAIVWAGDTGGYFGGRFFGGKIFGGRKMAPHISPKKTWEGAFFGLLASVVAAFVVNLVFLGSLGSLFSIFVAGLIGGMVGQLGDLVESMLKRYAGTKDSGALLPGHGGFLDRVDGILIAAPAVWLVLTYV